MVTLLCLLNEAVGWKHIMLQLLRDPKVLSLEFSKKLGKLYSRAFRLDTLLMHLKLEVSFTCIHSLHNSEPHIGCMGMAIQ